MGELASSVQLRAGAVRWALVLVPAILLLGFVSGRMANSGPGNPWFAALQKPDIYPPAGTFGIVWAVLYVLMGIALAIVCNARGARGRGPAVTLFLVQLLLNLAWSPVFFAMHDVSAAVWIMIALDIAVLLTMILFWRVRMAAGLLLVPYLAWVLFATALNWQFHALNPDAESIDKSGAVTRIEL